MIEQTKKLLKAKYSIDNDILDLCIDVGKKSDKSYEYIDSIREYNQIKVLSAMQEYGLSERHFSVSTGYGYDDIGREAIEGIYAKVFNTDDALVRPQIVSGTHALSLCLYGILRPGDQLISITGRPYDTIETIIGKKNDSSGHGTLKDYNIEYKQIELTQNGDIDISTVLNSINNNTKMIYIQRSTGYDWRRAISVDNIKETIKIIKAEYPEVIIMIDNCYGEFLDYYEPTDVGADIMAGSLIKNPGGGLAPTGGYVVGKKKLVYLAACRLSAPGIAKETGATLGINRLFLQGLFIAPHIVSEALKTAVFAANIFQHLGFEVCPGPKDYRSDIIQGIKFDNPEAVITFCKAVQEAAPVDAFVSPEPWDMPGYDCPVIMAAGSFIQGSSIELSADSPMRKPYVAYLQGGLTHDHGKIAIYLALQRLKEKNII